MKKILAILLVCALLFAVGCKKKEEPEVIAPTPTPEAVATPAPSPEATPEPSQEPEVYTYTNETYGYTVTMPLSWKDCCLIEEHDLSVTFYSAANRYMDIDGELYDCGKLFTIMVPEDDLKEGDGYVFPNYDIIGQYNGADILVVYPSDVQIADFDDEDAIAEFGAMYEEVPNVVASIMFG